MGDTGESMSGAALSGLNPDQLDAVVHQRRAAAGRRRRRLGQDPGAHPPHRPPHRRGRAAVGDPGHHVHQQGRRRDAPAGRRRWSGRSPGRCGCRTFHSACVRILRADGRRARLPAHVQRSTTRPTPQRLTGYVIRDLDLDPKRFPPRGVHGQISLWKNELVDPAARPSTGAGNIFERKHADIYAEYQARLLKAGAMDFDDLLMKTVELFREHPDVLEHYQQRFQHILVDEYQDTNLAQNEIVLLARRRATATSRRRRPRPVASTGSAAPTSATSRSSRRRSPTSPRSCSTRTTAARRRSSTPPTRSSPTTPSASRSTLWTDARHRRAHRPLPRRGRGRRGHVGRPHDAARCTTRRHVMLARDGRLLPHQRPEPRASRRR